jgi:hypothetical protein
MRTRRRTLSAITLIVVGGGMVAVGSKPRFAPPLPMDGKQFLADCIEDEFTWGDAFGFAVILDTVIQAFGDIRTDAFVP